MEFPFSLSFLKGSILKGNNDANDTICVIDGQFARTLSSEHLKSYARVIDEMGQASCKAQDLSKPVTAAHLLIGSAHSIFLLHDGQHTAKGILKIGKKKLFIHGLHHQYVEMVPLCVLDFYVHEDCQRMGIGHRLFEFMLKQQKTEPRMLAYDAPSAKLLGFLKKHYALKAFLPQNCNYVVFDDYFAVTPEYHFDPLEVEPVLLEADIWGEKETKERDDIAEDPNEVSVVAEEREMHADQAQYVNEEVKQADHEQKTSEQFKDDAFEDQSHQNQMTFIQKQIAQTKLEIKASEDKIHRENLEEVSPFSDSHPEKRAFDMRFRKKKSALY